MTKFNGLLILLEESSTLALVKLVGL